VRVRRLVAAALTGALLATAGCDRAEPRATEEWAGAVDQWVTNAQAAARAGVPNLSAFLHRDVVVDRRASLEGLAEGRDAALSLYRVLMREDPERDIRRSPYLAPEGLLLLAHASRSQPDSGADTALLLTLGAEGMEREESLLSVLSGRWRASVWRNGAVPKDWEPLEVIAERLLAVWARGDTAAVRALYADDAVVRDGLLDVHLAGVQAIERAAHITTPLQLATLQDLGGPAVFGAAPPLSPTFDRAVVVLETSGGRCPGSVAVSLRLDAAGRVAEETRYRSLDDLRRCLPAAQRPSGWWSHLSVPGPVPLTRTGTAHVDGGGEIEVYNGTPALQQLLEWALGRFQRAGLPLPRAASVTFYAAARDKCAGYRGLAAGEGFTDITLCFGEAEACRDDSCPPWATATRQLVLHELAHTWLSQNLADEDEDGFGDAVGLAWDERHDPWARRAMERAAETLAWGLDDWQVAVREFGSPSADRLARDFAQLTGAQPLSRPRASGAAD
jgi:hypothetical protein